MIRALLLSYQGVHGNVFSGSNVQGEGLGLTIAQRIIAMHHGRIWVESEQNKGSMFYVELPGPGNKMLDNNTDM